jgi:hypothetical protein
MTTKRFWLAIAALSAAACSPALDWREFVPEGSGIRASFPCRPDAHQRAVTIGGARASMRMFACSSAAMTFALSFVDVADPAAVGHTLAQLRESTVRNVQGVIGEAVPSAIANETANAESGRVTIDGQLPGGASVREDAAFFVRGLRVYQATVIGAKPAAAAVDMFLGSLKFAE